MSRNVDGVNNAAPQQIKKCKSKLRFIRSVLVG